LRGRPDSRPPAFLKRAKVDSIVTAVTVGDPTMALSLA